MECRVCGAGQVGGQCLLKGFVYAVHCAGVCETARAVRLRFAEHCQDIGREEPLVEVTSALNSGSQSKHQTLHLSIRSISRSRSRAKD